MHATDSSARTSAEINEIRTRSRLYVFSAVLFILIVILTATSIVLEVTAPTNRIAAITASTLVATATSLLASVVFLMVSLKIFGEPLQQFVMETRSLMREISTLHESASETGLLQMFPRRAGHQEVFFEMLHSPWTTLDILAVKIEFLTRDPRFEESLLRAARRGATIRILLADDSPSGLELRGQPEREKIKISVESVRNAIQACIADIECTKAPQLAAHREIHHVTILRIDSEMLYYSRVPPQKGASCPLYRVKRVVDGPFEMYLQLFEALWRQHSPDASVGPT